MSKKVGRIVAVVKDDQDQLQTIDFESGRVDTVDKVKADPEKNVALTAYEEFDNFNPENHKGQYVILRNCDITRGWDEGTNRVTVIDEIITQMADTYLGPPDYNKMYEKPEIEVTMNGNNRCVWTATKNGYAACHIYSSFNDTQFTTYSCFIEVNGKILYKHLESVGGQYYEMIETIPVRKGDSIELISRKNGLPDTSGKGIIYFIPDIKLSKSLFDLYYDELNTLNFKFKYDNVDLFELDNTSKWGLYDSNTFFRTATFNSLSNQSGELSLEVSKNEEMYGSSINQTLSFTSDLFNNHSFINNFIVKRVGLLDGEHCFTLNMEFYKKATGSNDVTVNVKLIRHKILNENIII
jgi:hypothetical protein